MSTRATYKLPTMNEGYVTVYIHYDGYPAGAAEYFSNMLAADRGINAETFIRVNERAELTRENYHGDTDYRYEVGRDGYVTIQKRENYDEKGQYASDRWTTLGRFELAEWVRSNLRRDENLDGKPIESRFYRINTGTDARHFFITSVAQWEQKLREKKDELALYAKAFPTGIGNIRGIESDIDRWIKLGEQIPSIEKKDITTLWVEELVK